MVGNVVEYEKDSDDAFVWIWDWANELLKDFYTVSPQVAFYRVYDASAATYRDIIERTWDQFVEMTPWPLLAGLQATDALYLGNILWPDEAAFSIDQPTTLAVYAGDALTWEYYNGTAWVALTLLYDETDSTANDGKRSFQVGGEIRFAKPIDMESIAIDGQTAEWIRVRPTTVANVTTIPVFAYTGAEEFVSSVALVDEGVTHARDRVDDTVSSAGITGVGEMEATMTTCVGRVVVKRFRFVGPDSVGDDYGS
jgi:hypothetical protein